VSTSKHDCCEAFICDVELMHDVTISYSYIHTGTGTV
jgi:hypothetical protein